MTPAFPPLRLAVVGSRGVPARYGGFETFAEELGARLAGKGIEVTVFCPGSTHDRPSSHRGMELRYAPSPKLGPLETLIYDLACLWRSRRGFDVVYMLGYTSSILCALPRIWGNEVWINMDGLEWKRSKWPWYGRLFLRCMEALAMKTGTLLVADSMAIKEHLQSSFRAMPPCEVIRYGTVLPEEIPEAAVLERYALEPDDYYLVVARLEPENHVLEMIEGFRSSGLACPLVIVGDHGRRTSYTRALLELADEQVRFVNGVYEKAELISLRWHARGHLHGHSVGGTNPSLLEAMACSNAVIAHDNEFNREVGGDAILFFDDSDSLADRLRKLDEDRSLRKRLGEAGSMRVGENYCWESIANRYEDLLRRRVAVGRGRSGSRLDSSGESS
jgi:glycosyltransferase involved in cell wall biosynthesis